MDGRSHRRMEHRENARDERLWMTEAGHDQRNLHRTATGLRKHGNIVRATFMEHESVVAGSFKMQRRKMLNTELRRAGY